jgi:hypothetical protein
MRYLTSPPIMVAPEPGEPMLLYITAIADAVSMVLVVEQSEPRQHQEPKAEEAPESQAQELPPSLEALRWGQHITEPQLPEADPGPSTKRPPGPSSWEPFRTLGARSTRNLNPWRWVCRIPPGGSGPSSNQCIISMKSSMTPR